MRKLILAVSATCILTTSFYRDTRNDIVETSIENSVPVAAVPGEEEVSADHAAAELYKTIDFGMGSKMNEEVFLKAFLGYSNLKNAGKLEHSAGILTVCDFSLSSTKKRLWVIDMNSKKVLFNELVAHGKNTGEEFATNFSNIESSLQSSMGFYITESTYNGSNGYSLKLIGMDKGYNDNAYKRAIVMHGADYISENFIKAQNRIGRSWGCPAVARELAEPIINTIKGQNVLFIYYPDQTYMESSEWLKA